MADKSTQPIRDYIKSHNQEIQSSLVSAFQYNFEAFEVCLQGAEMSPTWPDRAASDIRIRWFVQQCLVRWAGTKIAIAFQSFSNYVEGDDALRNAANFMVSEAATSPRDPDPQPPAGPPVGSGYLSRGRFEKTRRFRTLVALLTKKKQLFDLCCPSSQGGSTVKATDVCQLHGDTVGMGQDVCHYDARAGRVLLVVTLLGELQACTATALVFGPKAGQWTATFSDLALEIDRFFGEVENSILASKSAVTRNVSDETKAALGEMIENPSVRRVANAFVDFLVRFRENYTLTTMFGKNSPPPPEEGFGTVVGPERPASSNYQAAR